MVGALVVGVLERTGVFEYLAIRAAKMAGGRPYRVLVLLLLWLRYGLISAALSIAICVPYVLLRYA